ncbi:MAG: hypothetical protein JO307_11895 [Bryobacterales bacterium]|nr:hypothetical protein [Bryobacterales bacterium]MBV9400007.1 hypothetical protein [Bryobacterales bacterium]
MAQLERVNECKRAFFHNVEENLWITPRAHGLRSFRSTVRGNTGRQARLARRLVKSYKLYEVDFGEELARREAQTQELMIDFLNAEVELATSICSVATSTSDRDHRKQAVRHVQAAIASIRHFQERITDSQKRDEFISKADQLQKFISSHDRDT